MTDGWSARLEDIAELGTEIACQGAIAAMQVLNDQVFEQTVSIVAIVYEMGPV